MVEKRKANSGSFKPGNKVAVGNSGGNTPARQFTRKIISRAWFNALLEMDGGTQRTMADKLIRKACLDGLKDGVVALAVLKEGTSRIEGHAIQPIVSADLTPDGERRNLHINPNKVMGAGEAARIYQAVLKATRPGAEEDLREELADWVEEINARPDKQALPSPSTSYAPEPDFIPRHERKVKQSVPKRTLNIPPDPIDDDTTNYKRNWEEENMKLRRMGKKLRY